VWKAAENLPRVHGNPAEIREALTNLFLNAVDAMPNGGWLTVAGHAERDATVREAIGRVVLTVSDTGTGMIEETRRASSIPSLPQRGSRGPASASLWSTGSWSGTADESL
jgi:C4-dicarboxylate-specific signal transduction histidine kinase